MNQYFPKPYRSLEETLMLKLIYLIMQQKPIEGMQQELIVLILDENQI